MFVVEFNAQQGRESDYEGAHTLRQAGQSRSYEIVVSQFLFIYYQRQQK